MLKKVICVFVCLLLCSRVFTFDSLAANVISPSFNNEKGPVSTTDNEISAKNALSGYYVCSINDGYQQRYFKANIIKNLNKKVDTIVIGSSHFLPLSIKNDNEKFINLALGAANLKDRMNILGLLELYDIQYDNVLFEIDITSFVDIAMAELTEYSAFHKYGNYFNDLITHKSDVEIPELDFDDYYENKFSDISIWDLYKVYGHDNLVDGMLYYAPDASQCYDKFLVFDDENQRKTLKEDNTRLLKLDVKEENKEIIINIIKYFKSKGKNITLLMTPRPAYLYDDAKLGTSKIVKSINEFVISLIKDYNCNLLGSLNPHDIGVEDKDFMDGFHLTQEAVNRIYGKY